MAFENRVAVTLRRIIEKTIGAHPRSQQTAIGASEIGTPCARKLAFKLAGVEPVRVEAPAWRPTVGTAVHSWLELALCKDNIRRELEGRPMRWLTEERVFVGVYGGRELWGHVDVYDEETFTVVDWKVPGPTTVKKARAAKHPGETYRTQAHCYGLGMTNAGRRVDHVAVYFLPAAGELGDGYYWTEPFDRTVAEQALTRAGGVVAGLEQIGPDLIPLLPKTDDYCHRCPWWKPGTEDGDEIGSCPGVETATRKPKNDGPAFGPVTTERGAKSA